MCHTVRQSLAIAIGLAACVACGGVALADAKDALEHFEKRVRPVLVERCYECHSAKSEKVKGGLVLDRREGLIQGGDTGPALVPGDAGRSLLIKAVRYQEEDLRMPPKQQLSQQEVADLTAWVQAGAPWPKDEQATATPAAAETGKITEQQRAWWSYAPLRVEAPPAVTDSAWVRSDVDRHVLAPLESRGMKPVRQADRHTLIRRATFDLTGLPPTPAEVDAFLADAQPTEQAFAKVVERLLASPHYGERWGRHWMDLVRYADTAGDNSDFPVPQAYLYRNYIIDSFNDDKPYDQFVREQIAGDLMPHESWEQRCEQVIAAGYIAMSRRFGSVVDRYPQHLTIEDTLDNIGKTFLGLSMSCARCHDHKFDAVTQQDYYALYGFFQSTRYAFPGIELLKVQKDFVPLVPQDQLESLVQSHQQKERELDEKHNTLLAKRKELEAQKESLRQQHAGLTDEAQRAKISQRLVELENQVNQVRGQTRSAATALEKHKRSAPKVESAYAVQDGDVGDAKIQRKGDPEHLGAAQQRRFLEVLGGQSLSDDEAKTSGRLQLAQWVTSPDNPLFARVMVNRIWQYHFGTGLVATPSDFGVRGSAPSHPQLLDYLADRFIREDYSIKQMHRIIMNSSVYRLDSGRHEGTEGVAAVEISGGAAQAVDPDNRLLWRFNRQRLDAESIRDAMMFVSGALDVEPLRQAHPFPPADKWGFTQHYPFKDDYPSNKRSVYLMTRRLTAQPFFASFDGADYNTSTPVRGNSVTTVQALYLFNDEFVHEQAERFAERLLKEAADDEARIGLAFALALGRGPKEQEREALRAFVRGLREKLEQTKSSPGQIERGTWSSVARVMFRMNEFMYVD